MPEIPEDTPVVDITKLPAVDEARITYVFDELENMDVQLDADPLQYGPKRLNGKVAKARSMLSRCERIYLQVTHDLQSYKSAHRLAETIFELQIQDLMATDRETQSGRNVKMQEAIATTKLRTEKELINKLEICIGDLVMVLGVVKAKRADLKDIQGRLRDQLKLCAEEIGLGSGWGSKPPPGISGPDLSKAPVTNKRTLEQIQNLVDEGAEVDLGVEDVEEWTEGVEDSGEASLQDSPDVDGLLAEILEVEKEVRAEQPIEDSLEEEDPDKAIHDTEALLAEAAAEMEATAEMDTLLTEATERGVGEVEAQSSIVDVVFDLDDLIGEVASPPEETPPEETPPEETPPEETPSEEISKVTDVNLGDFFEVEVEAPGEAAKAAEEVLAATATDEEVDDIFNQLDVKPPKPKKAVLVADDNLDDLIDMFSQ